MNTYTGFWFSTYGWYLYQVKMFFHDIGFIELKSGCDEDEQETYIENS
jgi:hypothetical protein